MTLNWDDIFLQDQSTDFGRLLEQWQPPLVVGPIQPIGMSAFGDIYFLRQDGSVHVVDVFEGAVRQIAQSQEEFSVLMNSAEWRDANLMPEVIVQLQRRGLVRGPGQVFGFAPHPALAGKIRPEGALVLDAVVWHSICSQLLGSRGTTAA
ncbi:hypothetical protein [Aquabacterium humicola]|uniref:hypothetical protein n=1 Tax=Aquabacterium humicola TaxID=3237377 RepID=UPI002542B710|nr:hypothetical protein [Rubrivivax pictus]